MKKSVTLISRHADVVIARVEEDIDLTSAERVLEECLSLVPSETRGFVADLSGVRFVDSAGVHALFRLLRRLNGSGQRLGIVVPEHSPLRRLLKITGLVDHVTLCSSPEACADFLASPSAGSS